MSDHVVVDSACNFNRCADEGDAKAKEEKSRAAPHCKATLDTAPQCKAVPDAELQGIERR